MILTRSPYYITVPWLKAGEATVPDKYILQIFVWNGEKSTPPATPLYEEENVNPLGLTGSIDINISPYVNDLFVTTLTNYANTVAASANSSLWVQTQVIYYISGVAQSPDIVATSLAVAGYGYGIQGKNSGTPSNDLLDSATFVNVSKTTQYNTAFKISETDSVVVDVTSKPSDNFNYTVTIPSDSTAGDLVKNLFIDCVDAGTDTSFEIKLDTVLVQTLLIKDEARYTPIDVNFINKFGQRQTIVFFKEVIDSIKVTSDSYESSNGQPSDGIHQNVVYNKNGVSDFKAKTGFIDAENNEVIKQLLLSEKVWIVTGDLFNPVNVSSSGLEYKTRQRNRLIDYDIDFNYAYNELNNV
jgi:hypothetical protein